MALPVLLDTDIGSDVDDAVAMAVLLSAPDQLDLVAVTTVAANSTARASAAARLLGVAGRTDVSVHVGHEQALVRRDRFAWRDIETLDYPEDAPVAEIDPEPAAERIVRAAREVPGLELLAIGPLTNLAHALALDPELPQRVGGLTVMGGHIRRVAIGDHVCKPGIDYNLCSDPEASMSVLGAGFGTRLVTADVTLQTWLTTADLDRLEAAPGPLARVLANQIRRWTPWQVKIFTGLGGTLAEDNVAFLHDPLTVQALIDPAPLRFESLRILPTIENGIFRTLEVDPALGIGMPMEVATAVDAGAARAAILARLLRGG